MAAQGHPGVLLRALVCALVLLPPTILMGATLPAISRWWGATRDGTSDVGLLYMANIAGGAAGTLLAGFYLLRVHDAVVASLVAVGINVFAAALAFSLSRRYVYAARHRTIPSSIVLPARRAAAASPSSISWRRSPGSPPWAPRSCGRASCRCSSAPASTRSR